MANQNVKSAANEIQSLFDPQGYQNVLKTWAGTTELVTLMAVEAGTRSTDIASETTKEAFSNVRDVVRVREDPSEYGKAYSDFVQKQMDLFMRTAKAYAEVTQKAGVEMAALASKAGEEAGMKAAANAEGAAHKAGSAAKKAA